MLFSFEAFATLNSWLGGFWRLILLNLLWTAVTLLGLGLFGIGPASYALATYLDGWFRHGRTPPTIRTFLRDARERLGAAVAMEIGRASWRESVVCYVVAIYQIKCLIRNQLSITR